MPRSGSGAIAAITCCGWPSHSRAWLDTLLDVWDGAFSRPAGQGAPIDPQTAFNGVFKDSAAFNRRVHLLWFGAGTAEHLIHDSAKASVDALGKAGVMAVWVEFPGTAHEWQTWRKSLYDFAPRLFR